jgi:Fe-S cluster assembly iron-binding protein IscA
MALDEPEENEQTVQVDGLDFLIADFAQPFMDGSIIDYVELPDGEGFTILNGQASCSE